MNEAMCLATDVANEGGHRPKERSRPRGVSTCHTHILTPVNPASRHMLVTELLRADTPHT